MYTSSFSIWNYVKEKKMPIIYMYILCVCIFLLADNEIFATVYTSRYIIHRETDYNPNLPGVLR